MMRILAPVDNIRFDIEDALEKQTFSTLLPFVGMDKSAASVCELYVNSTCEKGNLCPFRHVKGDKSVVCKHWLRGLCKKGDECEFLHEYDMSKMPECFFYSKYSQCGNKECEFLHLDRESKIKDCAWYDRGFCRHGPNCKNRHQKKVICQNYLFGFCPEGPNCKFKHPKFELPTVDSTVLQKKQIFVCDFCGEKGHKITSCFKLNPEHRQQYQMKKELQNAEFGGENVFSQMGGYGGFNKKDEDLRNQDETNSPTKENNGPGGNKQHENSGLQQHKGNYMGGGHQFGHTGHFHHQFGPTRYTPLPPSEVTCFKCGEKGHYANRCSKSFFAILNEQQMNDSDK